LHLVIFVKNEMTMQAFITVLLVLHVLAGMIALITGGFASFTKKGGKGHRRSGKWYFWGMTGVFVTAIAVAILKGLAFLFMIGFFSYYFVVRGYRILYLKKLGSTQKATPLDWTIMTVAMAFGAGLVIWAFWQLRSGNSFWPVPLVFGLTAAGFAIADIRLFVNGPASKQHWITGHITSMGAGYIATWTAFVVTNVNFLPPVLVWLLPSLIGSMLIAQSRRRYTRPKSTELVGSVA
jgi:hypothetical protein